MAIETFRPLVRIEIDGQSRTVLGGYCVSGPKANFATATPLLDPSEGRPQPRQRVRIWGAPNPFPELLFTGEVTGSSKALASGELEVPCAGLLRRTQDTIAEPPTVVDGDDGGETEPVYLLTWEGKTAVEIIGDILEHYGIAAHSLEGDGSTYGNYEPVGLAATDNGWSIIEQLDEKEGYRTFDAADGSVRRQEMAGIPAGVGRTFTEGYDLFAGSLVESAEQTYNLITATGLPQIGSTGIEFTPADSVQAPSPWIPSPPTYRAAPTFSTPFLETGDDCTAYCARKMGELNRLRGELPFDLAVGDPTLRPGMSVAVDSLDLDVRANVRFWLTEVRHDWSQGFNTSGTLLMASEGLGWSPNQPPVAIIDASAKAETLDDATEIVVVALDGSASYDPELGVLGVVSYSWHAFGGGTLTPFDSAMRATLIYTGGIPDGAYVTLTVTDDLGKTSTARFFPTADALPIKRRDLISAENTRVQTTRDGGATWVTVSPNVAGVGVTEFAAAEYALVWEAGGDLYRVLADDTSELALAGANITAASITLANGDPDKKTGRCYGGAADGKVYRSYDDGVTWAYVSTAPNGQSITYIAESAFAEGDIEMAAGNAAYRSFDAGATWVEEFAHPNTDLIARRIASGFGKGWIGFSGELGDDHGESRLQERDDAVTLDADEPDKPISVVGLALDPYEDGIYVLDDRGGGDGRLFVGDSANGGNLTEMADWDIGWSTPRHMIRDGTAPGYLYIVGDTYLLKSVDGLATVLQLKLILGGAGRMIGYGAERLAAPFHTLEFFASHLTDRMLNLGNGGATPAPAGWYAAEFDASAWPLAVVQPNGIIPGVPGAERLWTSADADNGTEWAILRAIVAIPAGALKSATLTVVADNSTNQVYVNGINTGAVVGLDPVAIDVRAYLLTGRDNTIAILGKNDNGPAFLSWGLEITA